MRKIKAQNDSNSSGAAVIKTVSAMIFATAFSKILGLLRVILMAAHYGDSPEAAAFMTASRIPLTFFDLILGAAISGCFIPVYNSFYKKTSNKVDIDKADEFANIFINFILLITGIISLVGIIFSKQIISALTPGYNSYVIELAADLLRIMFPMIIFTGATYTVVGILQSKDEFLLPALVSSISNAGVIIYLIVGKTYFGIYGLAVAYSVSWVIQLVTLAIPLYRKKFRYKPALNFKNNALRKAIKSALPVMAGSWLIPVGTSVGQYFASLYDSSGAMVTSFEYANQLFLLVSGILTYGICNFIFPKLSRLSAQDDGEGFKTTVRSSVSVSFFIILPVSCLLYILRLESVQTAFMRGSFTLEAAEATAGLFAPLVIAMPAFAVIETLNRVFYSKNIMHIPMIAAICGISVNIGLSYFMVVQNGFPPIYLALSNCVGQFAAAGVLIVFLYIKIKDIISPTFLFNIIKIISSAFVSFLCMVLFYGFITANRDGYSLLLNMFIIMMTTAVGLVVYFILNFILKTDELKSFLSIISRKRNA